MWTFAAFIGIYVVYKVCLLKIHCKLLEFHSILFNQIKHKHKTFLQYPMVLLPEIDFDPEILSVGRSQDII